MKYRRKILTDAFSLNMVSANLVNLIRVRPILPIAIPYDVESAIGHSDTARVVSGILGWEIPVNRVNVTLRAEEVLYVVQYKGPRLPEGATTLPEGASLYFLAVTARPSCGGCPAIDCNSCGQMKWLQGR